MPHAKPSAKSYKRARDKAYRSFHLTAERLGFNTDGAARRKLYHPTTASIIRGMPPSQSLKGKKVGGAPARKVRDRI